MLCWFTSLRSSLVGWLLFDVISTIGGGSVLEMTKFV